MITNTNMMRLTCLLPALLVTLLLVTAGFVDTSPPMHGEFSGTAVERQRVRDIIKRRDKDTRVKDEKLEPFRKRLAARFREAFKGTWRGFWGLVQIPWLIGECVGIAAEIVTGTFIILFLFVMWMIVRTFHSK